MEDKTLLRQGLGKPGMLLTLTHQEETTAKESMEHMQAFGKVCAEFWSTEENSALYLIAPNEGAHHMLILNVQKDVKEPMLSEFLKRNWVHGSFGYQMLREIDQNVVRYLGKDEAE